jgi:hypothetical protein
VRDDHAGAVLHRRNRAVGTTHLSNVIGQHPAVYALPDETHFVIDPGGLEDLAHALTGAYTPLHGDDALRRFDRLMRVTLAGLQFLAFAILMLARTASV